MVAQSPEVEDEVVVEEDGGGWAVIHETHTEGCPGGTS